MAKKVVPFNGNFKFKARGPQVRAVKRALAHAGHGKVKGVATNQPFFGAFAVKHLNNFKKKHGLKPDGTYNMETHRLLVPYFKAFEILLYTKKPPKKAVPADRLVAVALALYSIKDRLRYTQDARRMDIVRNKRKPPFPGRSEIYEDCSSFVTGIYWLAGFDDPNGNFYNGQGYTGTLALQGWRVPASEAQKGDLAFYGAYPHKHVVMCLGNGRAISFGSDSGPHIVSLNYRSDLSQVRRYV